MNAATTFWKLWCIAHIRSFGLIFSCLICISAVLTTWWSRWSLSMLGMLKNFPVEIHFPTWLVPKVWSLISVEHELLVRMVNQGLKSKQSCCSSNSFINHQSITNTCQFQQTISDPASLSNVLHQILNPSKSSKNVTFVTCLISLSTSIFITIFTMSN